jgi:hypothetical protein
VRATLPPLVMRAVLWGLVAGIVIGYVASLVIDLN